MHGLGSEIRGNSLDLITSGRRHNLTVELEPRRQKGFSVVLFVPEIYQLQVVSYATDLLMPSKRLVYCTKKGEVTISRALSRVSVFLQFSYYVHGHCISDLSLHHTGKFVCDSWHINILKMS